jgi:mannose/cellobiose epimerase-like protein (N-acyl-D-glucosamine 2-epimerase family)
MIYRFKCKATGDTVLLGPTGDALLRALGRQPVAQGIIEVSAMPAAIAALLKAAEEDAAQRASDVSAESGERRDPVPLKQRFWPMVEMLRQAHAAAEPIVWGV